MNIFKISLNKTYLRKTLSRLSLICLLASGCSAFAANEQDHDNHPHESKAQSDHKSHDNHREEHEDHEDDDDHEKNKDHQNHEKHSSHSGHGAHGDEHAEFEKGPHGGRLLKDKKFTVELAIFERGVPPEYRAWGSYKGKALNPDEWNLNVKLERLGGRVDDFKFVPSGDFLLGQGVVEEPHSFDVSVSANYKGKTYRWEFESHEGRIEMTSELAKEVGLGLGTAGSGIIHETILLYGRTVPDPQKISHITARFPGLIRSVKPQLGDKVKAGDVVAIIEANDSLQRYSVKAPIDGIVVKLHANPGEFASDQHLMTIADYSKVWVDLNVFPRDALRIQANQPVTIRMGPSSGQSTVRYLNPGDGKSPNVIARVPLDNPNKLWTPGLLVEGNVTVAKFPVPLVVDNRAVQSFRDWQVVFIKVDNTYEIRPLELGRSDGHFTEVLAGLNPGDHYVVENSYLLKADLEKSGASHDH